MYKFRRRIYVKGKSMNFWFGLTSKSRNRHSNFTLYLLTDGPDSAYSYAEPIKDGIHSKAEAEKIAIQYAKELFANLLEREKDINEESNSSEEYFVDE